MPTAEIHSTFLLGGYTINYSLAQAISPWDEKLCGSLKKEEKIDVKKRCTKMLLASFSVPQNAPQRHCFVWAD